MKSSVPPSAQWRSSKTRTTGPVAASRSKKVRHAPNNCSASMSVEIPSNVSRAGSIQRRSGSSRRSPSSNSPTFARVVRSSSVSARPARPRIISDSAQKVMPSPYEGERPRCHHTSPTIPSRYFSNSHVSRLLPMPPIPVTLTRRVRCSRSVAWNRSLSSRSSSSRPTNGASRVSLRPRPPRSATTRIARHAGTGATLPLSDCSPTGSKAIAELAARWVASPTRTVPGSATDWSRAAVLTRSPATMPWFVAPRLTVASPVRTPARALSPGPTERTASTSSRAARTQRSASSSRAVGVPHTAITASPMNFSTVPP